MTRRSQYHRVLDIVAVGAILPIALVPMIVIAVIVLAAFGRPFLFRQQRSGRGGMEFTLVKFRTMSNACRPDGIPLPDAARTSRLGRLLRRTRLDELPELWNILRGDMSLIGPRPLLPRTIENMGLAGRRRGAVRPGLTGWAQTSGNSILTNADKLALDLWYVENRSIELDVLVVVRTIALMIAGDKINHHRLNVAKRAAREFEG